MTDKDQRAQRAREVLAAEYASIGFTEAAGRICRGNLTPNDGCAIRAMLDFAAERPGVGVGVRLDVVGQLITAADRLIDAHWRASTGKPVSDLQGRIDGYGALRSLFLTRDGTPNADLAAILAPPPSASVEVKGMEYAVGREPGSFTGAEREQAVRRAFPDNLSPAPVKQSLTGEREEQRATMRLYAVVGTNDISAGYGEYENPIPPLLADLRALLSRPAHEAASAGVDVTPADREGYIAYLAVRHPNASPSMIERVRAGVLDNIEAVQCFAFARHRRSTPPIPATGGEGEAIRELEEACLDNKGSPLPRDARVEVYVSDIRDALSGSLKFEPIDRHDGSREKVIVLWLYRGEGDAAGSQSHEVAYLDSGSWLSSSGESLPKPTHFLPVSKLMRAAALPTPVAGGGE